MEDNIWMVPGVWGIISTLYLPLVIREIIVRIVEYFYPLYVVINSSFRARQLYVINSFRVHLYVLYSYVRRQIPQSDLHKK